MPPEPSRSQRLVEFADALREHANTGHVVGAVALVLLPGRRFLVEVLGEAERDPVFARGALKSADDVLSTMAQHRRDSNTTL